MQQSNNPQAIIQNTKLLQEYNLEDISVKIPKLLQWEISDDFSIFSQAYAGHQFGGFSILWDWRAHIIKEIEHNWEIFDIQLKWSGATKYSRWWDGKANLPAMLREYIISESMSSLWVATNRVLWVYTTWEEVWRNWNNTWALLVRLASSHIRVGTFEYVSYLNDIELLDNFTNYTIERHFPEITHSHNKYLDFLQEVWNKQITTVINWMRVGFIHGVMNTDNTFISWETLDYGPCAFINSYNPHKVFSSIDEQSRYAFINQKHIILWNIARLIESLLPLTDTDSNIALEKWKALLNDFEKTIEEKYTTMLHNKIWLTKYSEATTTLTQQLLSLLEKHKLDYTNSFVSLEKYLADSNYSDNTITVLKDWIVQWESFIEDSLESISLMQKTNPKVIPRNHLVEKALESASNGDMDFMNDFLKVLSTPYKQPIWRNVFRIRPKWCKLWDFLWDLMKLYLF